MEIRRARHSDLPGLLALYTQLHGNAMPRFDEALDALWRRILGDDNHHLLVGVRDGDIVSSCVLLIIPNLTHGQRPYALVENVITREDCRKRGYASRLLRRAAETAAGQGCYKIMLMTGSKEEGTLRFYEQAGFNRHDKTAFIQWL
jgi:ribosomal protein S18 acetylase RimI-like enzyme